MLPLSLSTYQQVLWQTLIYARVDLSSIKAITHDGVTLSVLIERDHGYCLESPPAPLQAFQGLQQLAQFTTELQQSDNRLTARTQLLDQFCRLYPLVKD